MIFIEIQTIQYHKLRSSSLIEAKHLKMVNEQLELVWNVHLLINSQEVKNLCQSLFDLMIQKVDGYSNENISMVSVNEQTQMRFAYELLKKLETH